MGKKIFFVGNTAWSMYNFRLEVMKSLSEAQFMVTVVAPEDSWSEKLILAGIPFIPMPMDNKGTAPLKDLQLLRNLFRLYRREKPDLIFHYTIKPNIYGSVAAALCGIKSIAFVTGAGSVFIRNNLLTRIVKTLFRGSFRLPEQVWFLNKDDLELFTQSRLVRSSKCCLLPGEGIDTEKFSNAEVRPEAEGAITFLFLGRLLWDKGVGQFVDAAREIRSYNKDVYFHVLGFPDPQNPSGIGMDQVEAWSKEGIIEYLGFTDNVKEIILNADCVVLPTYREGIPRSLLEAASLERPVIATDVPGCREVVEDKITGFLCLPQDHKDLREKMEAMINMSEADRIRMGKAGRDKVQSQFRVELIINRYREAVSDLLGPPSGATCCH